MNTLSPLFISHGAPTLPFEDVPARTFLIELAKSLPRPRAILMVSAHWETQMPRVTAQAHPHTIHDFSGFPEALYQLRYPAPGDPALAARIIDLLADAGMAASADATRGLDHGAWVPLMLMWPAADIPVVQLSIQSHLGPGHHLQLGQALAPLTRDGVQIIASGSLTHDLSSWRGQAEMAEPDWVTDFAEWIYAALANQRICDLLTYRRQAPFALRNHPSEEHLLALFVALGAAGPAARSMRLHQSTTYGVLRMDAFQFHPSPQQNEGNL